MRNANGANDVLVPTSTGARIGNELVRDLREDRIPFDGSSNTFPRFPGAIEEFDHSGFLNYLESDMGIYFLKEMMLADENYQFI